MAGGCLCSVGLLGTRQRELDSTVPRVSRTCAWSRCSAAPEGQGRSLGVLLFFPLALQFSTFLVFFFLFVFLLALIYNVMLVSAVYKVNQLHIYMYAFLDSFPIYIFTEYCVESPVLCSRSLLVIYFIYSSVYMLIQPPNLFLPLPFSPLVAIRSFSSCHTIPVL